MDNISNPTSSCHPSIWNLPIELVSSSRCPWPLRGGFNKYSFKLMYIVVVPYFPRNILWRGIGVKRNHHNPIFTFISENTFLTEFKSSTQNITGSKLFICNRLHCVILRNRWSLICADQSLAVIISGSAFWHYFGWLCYHLTESEVPVTVIPKYAEVVSTMFTPVPLLSQP